MRPRPLSFLSALFLASVCLNSATISAQTGSGTASPAAVAPTGVPPNGAAIVEPKRVGGAVSTPVILSKVDAKYTDEARKANVSGTVLVNLLIDEQGNPSNVHVVRGVGMGLDESAVAAVKQYKFQPATENGKPVLVQINVEITFRVKSKAPAAYESDPKFVAAMAEGKKLSGTQQINFAIDAYKKANKIAAGKCADCLQHIEELQMKTGSFKDAAASAAGRPSSPGQVPGMHTRSTG